MYVAILMNFNFNHFNSLNSFYGPITLTKEFNSRQLNRKKVRPTCFVNRVIIPIFLTL